MNVETYKALPGERLDFTIEQAVARVAAISAPVRFEFNGADVVVQPGQTADDINAEVERQWEANSNAYRASPEGKRAAQEAVERLEKAQTDHDALMREMSAAFASEPSTMDWLDRYSAASDHIDVRGVDFLAVIGALEAAGYARSDATHLPQEEYLKPHIMARYVAGQAIDCMHRGLPPHQITHTFVEKYRALLSACSPEPRPAPARFDVGMGQ